MRLLCDFDRLVVPYSAELGCQANFAGGFDLVCDVETAPQKIDIFPTQSIELLPATPVMSKPCKYVDFTGLCRARTAETTRRAAPAASCRLV